MNIIEKIDKLRKERGWSINKLALEACLTQSTVQNLFLRKNSNPSFATLNAICDALNITLAEFFNDDKQVIYLSENEKLLIDNYRQLNKNCQKSLFELIQNIKES